MSPRKTGSGGELPRDSPHSGRWPNRACQNWNALATMGPEGIAILTNSMRSGSEWSTMCAIWSLGQHPEAGAQAIPFLIQATSSESEGIACGGIQVLGMLRLDAEHVVPALTNAFNSPKPAVRRDACDALLKFSPRSDPAARTGTSH